MAIKIYIPKNDYLAELVKNFGYISSKYELVQFDTNDNIIEAFNNNEIDLALVDPLTYAQITSEFDYYIVPTKCLSAIGYTGLATIYFGQNLRSIQSLAYCSPNEYFSILSSILFNEKYSFEVKTTKISELSIQTLENYDAILSTQKFSKYKNTLDLTEEWFDTFETPLPIALWIVSEQYAKDVIKEITNNLFNYQDNENLTIKIVDDAPNQFGREGTINYNFSDEFVNSFNEIIQLFYQLGIIDDMKELKILGEDKIEKTTP